MSDLRRRVFAGGRYLMVRQVISLVVGLVGVLLLTRLIGPTEYGRYAGSLAFVILFTTVGRAGVDVYLVRRPEEPDERLFDQARTILLVFGIVVGGIAAVVVPFVLGLVSGEAFVDPLRVLLLSAPLTLMQTPPFAKLERGLHYRSLAILELSNQVLFYGIAIPLAATGLGVWAPVAAWIATQAIVVPAAYVAARMRPGLTRSMSGVRDMLIYSTSFAASTWVWDLRTLVNPIVVGYFFGPRGVGYVSLAVRIVDMVGFSRIVAYRLSIAAFAKVAAEPARLRRAVEESMVLQVLAIAPFLIVFGLAGPELVPLLFGEEWLPVLDLYPYIAVAAVVNAVFNAESSALYVLARNRQVAVFHALNVALLAVAAVVLLEPVGLEGYGVAELVALASYWYLHLAMSAVFPVSYAAALPWVIALVPPLFAVSTPMPWKLLLFAPLVGVLLSSARRRQLGRLFAELRPRLT